MINGPDVMSKYNVIVNGRRNELYRGLPFDQRPTKFDELAQFISEIRACKREEFEQWYQLYS